MPTQIPDTKMPTKKYSNPDISAIKTSATTTSSRTTVAIEVPFTNLSTFSTSTATMSNTNVSNTTTSATIITSPNSATANTPTNELPTRKSSILENPTEKSLFRMLSFPDMLTGRPLTRRPSISEPSTTKELPKKPSIPEISNSKMENRKKSPLVTPNYSCTLMPSICKASFDRVIDWIRHELSPDHNFLSAQTEWLCAHRATKEFPLTLPRNDLPIIGGCNLAFNSPAGLLNHWKENNEVGTATEFTIGKAVQRFWCGFCQKIHIIGLSDEFCWDKGRIDHIRAHFEGLPGQPETKWKIEQWKEYTNMDDASWKDLPPQEWKLF